MRTSLHFTQKYLSSTALINCGLGPEGMVARLDGRDVVVSKLCKLSAIIGISGNIIK